MFINSVSNSYGPTVSLSLDWCRFSIVSYTFLSFIFFFFFLLISISSFSPQSIPLLYSCSHLSMRHPFIRSPIFSLSLFLVLAIFPSPRFYDRFRSNFVSGEFSGGSIHSSKFLFGSFIYFFLGGIFFLEMWNFLTTKVYLYFFFQYILDSS